MKVVVFGEELIFESARFPVVSADSPEQGGEGISFTGLSIEVGGVDAVAGPEDVGTRDALEAEEEGVGVLRAFLFDGAGKGGRRVGLERDAVIAGPLIVWPGSVGEEGGLDCLGMQAPDQAGEVALGTTGGGVSPSGKKDFHGAKSGVPGAPSFSMSVAWKSGS